MLNQRYAMFGNYTEEGPSLLTDSSAKIRGRFILRDTSTTIANTLRRSILSETRSVGFRADLTNQANPGIQIKKNTGAVFNEMLAHRLTLIPLGVRRIDDFDPTRYECVLHVMNDKKGVVNATSMRHVTASDFVVREKQEDGSFVDMSPADTTALFPADPITGDTCLITSLKPQWNPDQPPEEISLVAYPVIGRGREHMGFCPVSQCSYENTLDEDPVRQDEFFHSWLAEFKKIVDVASIPPEVIAGYRAEWSTMAIQRCFMVNEKGEPNSFTFTIESVGIRPVKDLVAEGIQEVVNLVTPYCNEETSLEELNITMQPVDSRMNGLDVLFDGQEHTLGNLLQTVITEMYLDGSPDSPITYVGYKLRHPLQRIMALRVGIRDGAGDSKVIVREVIVAASVRIRTIFENLASSWASMGGVGKKIDLDG